MITTRQWLIPDDDWYQTIIDSRRWLIPDKNNTNVYTAYIDLKKAFDYVDRDMLLYKLLKLGVDGKIYRSIKSMYEKTIAAIKINKKHNEMVRLSVWRRAKK